MKGEHANIVLVWLALLLVGAATAGMGLLWWKKGVLPQGLGGNVPTSDPHHLAQAVFTVLEQQKSNLARPHSFAFYFYFSTRTLAEEAATDLQSHGFGVTVRPAAVGKQWLCLANRSMAPDRHRLTEWGEWFAQIAAAHNGEYDGWESTVEK